MKKHKYTGTIYPIRPIGKYPQAYVSSLKNRSIEIEYFPIKNHSGVSVYFTRRDARLLVKRIHLCLEDTK